MNINENTINEIIKLLKDADGETIEYIVSKVPMQEQLLKQLFQKATDFEVNNLIEERESLIKDESLKGFWSEVRNTEHERKSIAQKVWNDMSNNDTLIYDDFESYWKSI